MSTVLSSGTVQLDARAAREKLRDYMLAEPALYVVELARAAVASGATAITVRNDSDDLELTFDGQPFAGPTLARVLDHVFDARVARERLLAIGINTALGLVPKYVDVYTSVEDGPTVTRVRWTPGSLVTADGTLSEPATEMVRRPDGMPATATRIHVRERLGTAVLSELFRAGPPVEAIRLAEHATARSIPVRRGDASLAPVPVPDSAIRKSVRLAGVGTVEMTLPGTGRLDLAEHGFLLERRWLPVTNGTVPVDVLVDSPALPTNASRSQVAFDESIDQALAERIATLSADVIREAARGLDGPGGAALRELIVAFVVARFGASWATSATGRAPEKGREDLDDLLFQTPVVPLATGGYASIRDVALSVCARGVFAWRKKALLDADLARWLGPVVWMQSDTPHVAALVAAVGEIDPQTAITGATRLASRWQRWHAHPARTPAVDRHTDDELVRIPFGDRRAAGDSDDAVPREESGAVEGIIGEVVVRAASGEPSLRVTAFVDGRPIGTTTRAGPALCVEVAVGSPALKPSAALDGAAEDVALRRAISAAARALLAAIALVVDARNAPQDDPRLRWIGAGLARTTPGTLRWLARVGLDLLGGSFGGEPGAPGSAQRRVALRPALADFPVWPTVVGEWLSTSEIARQLGVSPHAICFASPGATCTRTDGRPVLVLDARALAVLRALEPSGCRFVDYTPFTARPVPGPLVLPPSETRPYPALPFERDGVRGLVAPSTTQGTGTLVLMHRGRLVQTLPRTGSYGDTTLVLEDEAFVPDPEDARATLSPQGSALELAADLELAVALARAAQGDRGLVTTLGLALGPLPGHAVRFLMTALAALRARPADQPLRELEPRTAGELVRLLEAAPLFDVQLAGGGHTVATIAQLAARAASGPLPWIATAAPDVDLGELEPLVLRDPSLAIATADSLGILLVSAQDRVAQLRSERAHAGELERWARAQPRETRDPGQLVGAHAVRAQIDGDTVVAAVADGTDAGVTIRWREYVVGKRALVLPVNAWVTLSKAEWITPPEGLARVAEPIMARLVARAVRMLVDEICERAAERQPPNDAELRFVARWVADRPPDPPKSDRERLDALARAPLWRLAQGGVGSAASCVASDRVRTSRVFFPQWRGPETPGEADVAPAIHLRAGDDAYEACLVRLTGVEAFDSGEALARLQRMRVARASVDLAQLRLPGEPPAAALAGRLEKLSFTSGFGELRVVPASGLPTLELVIVDPQAGGSRASLPSPIALAAIVQPVDSGAGLTTSERQARVAAEVIACAHRLVDAALVAGATLPEWSERAVRWHLLTTDLPSSAAAALPIFRDSEGRPMTLRDLDAEVSLHAAVACSIWWPQEALTPSEPLLRVLLVWEWELEWLRARRALRDYSAQLADDWCAYAFRTSAPAASIRVGDPVPSDAQRCALDATTHGYEGEVVLLPWSGAGDATISWYLGRRPLGRSTVPAAWPALVALEVPGLTPNRACSQPVDDAALQQASTAVTQLVYSLVTPRFAAPDEAVAWVQLWQPSSPARTGARTLALGAVWLPPDALAETFIQVYALGVAPTRSSPLLNDRGRWVRVPLAGCLYFHKDAGGDEQRAALATSIVKWAHEELMRILSELMDSRPTGPSDAELTHATRAIVDGVSGPLERWADRTRLPGSITTFGSLRSMIESHRWLVEVPAGDPRAREQQGVVSASSAPWLGLLRARQLVRPASPMDGRLEPGPSGGASASPPTGAKRVMHLVRSCGIDVSWLSAIRAERRNGKRAVRIDAQGPVAVLDTAHPAVAAWLADADDAAAARLAAIIVGESNRASLEVTDDDEGRVLVLLLEALGA